MEWKRCVVPTPTRAPTGTTNAYVIGFDQAVLVDPAGRTDDLDRLVSDRSIEHVFLTHTHPDHVGAVRTYAEQTGATVWGRYGRTDRFRDAVGRAPDRVFGPGTTISLGDERLRILDAPGHAVDHVAVEVGIDGPIVCGDCAVQEGSVVVGAPEGDMRAYLSTLRRLRAIDPPALLPGHGPMIDDPRATIGRLIAHRRDRERRILGAVDAGASTLDEILDRAYDKDLTGVEDLARATVRAHLEKLAVEGQVRWDGDREWSSA